MKFRTNNKKTISLFNKRNQQIFIDQEQGIRVIKTDTNNFETAILFIHGTPGSGDAFYNYLSDTLLLSKATLITYDRPGYGYSNYGKPMTSIINQATAALPIISKYKKVYLVGHSYGGPIATYLALKSPNVQGVLLIAPTMIPHQEKYYSLAQLGTTWLGKLMTSKAMYVASKEKIDHQKSIEEAEKEWSVINSKITHIHSSDDKIVPFTNIDYTKKTFTNTKVKLVKLNEGDHFLPWNHYQLIQDNILELMQ